MTFTRHGHNQEYKQILERFKFQYPRKKCTDLECLPAGWPTLERPSHFVQSFAQSIKSCPITWCSRRAPPRGQSIGLPPGYVQSFHMEHPQRLLLVLGQTMWKLMAKAKATLTSCTISWNQAWLPTAHSPGWPISPEQIGLSQDSERQCKLKSKAILVVRFWEYGVSPLLWERALHSENTELHWAFAREWKRGDCLYTGLMGPGSYLLAKVTSLGEISGALPFFRSWSQRRHPTIAERADEAQQLLKRALPQTFFTSHDANETNNNQRLRLKALDVIWSYLDCTAC